MKERLDKFISVKFDNISRTKAQSLIESGFVLVDGKEEKRTSFVVDDNNKVELLRTVDQVSRGAYKLIGAIKTFKIDFQNKIVLDVGASTGGFTEVSLESGAKKVYAVDVGKDQLNKKIASDDRVVNLQGRDIRTLTKNDTGNIDIIIGDVSFISLTKIFEHLKELYGNNIEMMFLFKPQFECGPEKKKKYKGVIKNSEIHKKLLKNFVNFAKLIGFSPCGLAASPIHGGDGNIEYLVYFSKEKYYEFDIDRVVNDAFSVK